MSDPTYGESPPDTFYAVEDKVIEIERLVRGSIDEDNLMPLDELAEWITAMHLFVGRLNLKLYKDIPGMRQSILDNLRKDIENVRKIQQICGEISDG